MTDRTAFTAVYAFEDGAWQVSIRGQRGCQTYGRSLRQAQSRIREALSLWLDVPPDALVIVDEYPTALAAVARTVRQARAAASAAEASARQQTAAAVSSMTEIGLSRRDAAQILGLSHQRVQQLLDAR